MHLDGNHLVFAGFLTMRELYKPVHPKFIFAKDWIKMTREEQDQATKDGKFKIPSANEFRKMKGDEFKEWKAQVQPILDELHGQVLDVFNSFPKSLLLVCRFGITLHSFLFFVEKVKWEVCVAEKS